MRPRLLVPGLAVLGFATAIAACDATTPPADAGHAPPAEAQSLAPWSRRAGTVASNSGVESAAPAPTSPDPAALEELLAAAPAGPPKSTGEDGGTAIGAVTHEPDAGAADAGSHKAPAARKPQVEVGEMQIQPPMSSPAVERLCRQQIYWNLVMRCRDKTGAILPPDAVKLDFLIDPDGYITPSSILASTEVPAFEEAARCMRRELSATTFRAPASTRGMSTHVTGTVPSVD